jgi:hypothetical protein
MNEQYKKFVEFGRQLAAEHEVNWDMRLNQDGMVIKDDAWNLTQLIDDSPPPNSLDTRLWVRC